MNGILKQLKKLVVKILMNPMIAHVICMIIDQLYNIVFAKGLYSLICDFSYTITSFFDP